MELGWVEEGDGDGEGTERERCGDGSPTATRTYSRSVAILLTVSLLSLSPGTLVTIASTHPSNGKSVDSISSISRRSAGEDCRLERESSVAQRGVVWCGVVSEGVW